MSDEFETNQNEYEVADDQTVEPTEQLPKRVDEMSIQELRRLATSYNIKASRDWDRTDFIEAINNRRSRSSLVELVEDNSGNPLAGKARITIQSPEQGSTHPVPVNVNNYFALIPRDIQVDIPIPALEALNNSTTPVRVKDPKGGFDRDGKPKMVWRHVPTYHVTVHSITPGIAKGPNGQPLIKPSTSLAKHNLKMKYKEIYGRWPKREQFRKFEEMHMERIAERALNEDVSLAKQSKGR